MPLRKWLAVAGCSAALIFGCGALMILYFIDPHKPGFYPACPFLTATRLYCPGCGSLRATHYLLHGNLAAALSRNILAVLLIPVALWSGAVDIERRCFHSLTADGKQWRIPQLPLWMPKVVLVVVIVFWVARNLPWWPFTMLTPDY